MHYPNNKVTCYIKITNTHAIDLPIYVSTDAKFYNNSRLEMRLRSSAVSKGRLYI